MSALQFQKIEIDRLAGIPRGSGFRLEELSMRDSEREAGRLHGQLQ
jgi:hypothetical protein